MRKNTCRKIWLIKKLFCLEIMFRISFFLLKQTRIFASVNRKTERSMVMLLSDVLTRELLKMR